MSVPVRLFVAVSFLTLAAALIGLSAVLYSEYQTTEWFALAAFDSQLFLFFPLFGTMALISFYRPACVVFDIYWRHVIGGRWIASIVLVTLVAAAPMLAQLIRGSSIALWDTTQQAGPISVSLWDLTPETLESDPGEACPSPKLDRDPAGQPIAGAPGTCARAPFLEALKNLRAVYAERTGMSVFVRNCRPDTLAAIPASELEPRYCFVNDSLQTARQCCAAQQSFQGALMAAHRAQGVESETGKWYRLLLPFHTFFLLMIFAIGVALVARGKWLDLPEYRRVRRSVEARVLAGAVIMLFWPLLNHAFLQSADILYGNHSESAFRFLVPLFTAVFGVWTLLLLFFYFRAFPEAVKKVGQMAGVVGSAIAFLKFDEIVDALSRAVGAGSDQTSIGVVLLFVAAIVALAIANRFSNAMAPGDASGVRDERSG